MTSTYWKTRTGEFMRIVDDAGEYITVQSVRPGSMPIRVHRRTLNRWEPMATIGDPIP